MPLSAPTPKDKIHKTDDDRCWRCGGGKRKTCHHLIIECRAWHPQTSKLWKDIYTGKAYEWKHPRAPSVRWLWKEKSTEVVLGFLGSTRVECISTGRTIPEERNCGAGSGGEGKEDGPGPPEM